MAKDEDAGRMARVGEALRGAGLDALLALGPENAAYLSGRTSLIATLWREPGLVAVAVGRDGGAAVAAGDAEIDAYPAARFRRFPFPLWIERIDLRRTEGGEPAARVRAARPDGAWSRPAQYDRERVLEAVALTVEAVVGDGARIGADLGPVPPALAARLRERLGGIELVDAAAVFDELRAVKDDGEIANVRLAAELTEVGIAAARDALRPGLSRVGVQAAYQSAIWERAAADERFAGLREVEGLIAIGDGAEPDSVAPGRTVKLDMQVDVGGCHSDVGRTFALAATADQRVVYGALHRALLAAQAAVGPGVPCGEVFRVGVAAMREAGFLNYSRGHLGHSVGLAHNFEEPPFIADGERWPLRAGMVISLELPYTLVGIGAFQLERMLLITESGAEALDRLTFALDPGSG